MEQVQDPEVVGFRFSADAKDDALDVRRLE
jgi:hypothetical protein